MRGTDWLVGQPTVLGDVAEQAAGHALLGQGAVQGCERAQRAAPAQPRAQEEAARPAHDSLLVSVLLSW